MVELEYVGDISFETVRRVKKNELKPWKVKGWIIAPLQSSDFVAHMEQILDVYKYAYNQAYPVICMDESPKQLIKETPVALQIKPGSERKEDYEYQRCGVVNIFITLLRICFAHGMSLEKIKDFLGHSSLESTQIYTHLINENDELV